MHSGNSMSMLIYSTTAPQMPYYSSIPGQPFPQQPPPVPQPPITIQNQILSPEPWQPTQPVVISSGSPARPHSPEPVQPTINSVPPVVHVQHRPAAYARSPTCSPSVTHPGDKRRRRRRLSPMDHPVVVQPRPQSSSRS